MNLLKVKNLQDSIKARLIEAIKLSGQTQTEIEKKPALQEAAFQTIFIKINYQHLKHLQGYVMLLMFQQMRF